MTAVSTKGLDVTIEGGSVAEQFAVGAIVSHALEKSGFSAVNHYDRRMRRLNDQRSTDRFPSLLTVIKERQPDFLETPIIISAYHQPSVKNERRSLDRVMEGAKEFLRREMAAKEEIEAEWRKLSLDEKEALIAA